MATVVVTHPDVLATPANPSVGIDSTKWNHAHTVTGLENVDNTSDVNKPVSTAQQAALALKADATALALKANANAVVSSLNGQLGALTFILSPQGRLTLATGVPVMGSTQSAKTTIFYTPYTGNQIPVYDGTNMIPATFTELSAATSDITKSPAAIGASKINDWFVWNDAGTVRLGHGPDWTNDTTRSVGTALVMVNGILLNNASLAPGPGASRGTYVGTTRSNSSSQLNWILGGSDTAGDLAIWNAYNRKFVTTVCSDTTATWSYTSATVRQARASANNQISFVSGLAEDSVVANTMAMFNLLSATTASATLGLGLDSITVLSKSIIPARTNQAGTITNCGSVTDNYIPQLGYHYVAALEAGDGTNATTFIGGAARQGLSIWTMM